MSFGAEVGNLCGELFSDFVFVFAIAFRASRPPAGESRKPFQESWSRIDLGIPYTVVVNTCVHYLGPPGPSTSQILFFNTSDSSPANRQCQCERST